jgi:hypothetical protein
MVALELHRGNTSAGIHVTRNPTDRCMQWYAAVRVEHATRPHWPRQTECADWRGSADDVNANSRTGTSRDSLRVQFGVHCVRAVAYFNVSVDRYSQGRIILQFYRWLLHKLKTNLFFSCVKDEATLRKVKQITAMIYVNGHCRIFVFFFSALHFNKDWASAIGPETQTIS